MSLSAKNRKVRIDTLRQRAEAVLKEQEGKPSNIPLGDISHLIHELGTYQIELEMQNEELRRAQDEIEESRHRYVDLYDFAPVGYMTLDEFGRVVEMNLTASNMLGKPRAMVRNKDFLKSFVYPEDVEKLRTHTVAVIGGDDKAVMELRMRRPDGTLFHAQLRSRSVKGVNDKLLINVAISDITLLKEAEANAKAAERAEHAARRETEELKMQRLENLRVLAGGIAHDLNNLMVAVQANTELALRELPQGKAREYVEGIEAAVARVSSLAHQILSYTGKGQAEREPMDLNRFLKDTSKLLMASLPRNMEMEYHLGEGLPSVVVDHQGIQQIMMNLIINAADSLEGRPGRISLSTGSLYADQSYMNKLKTGRKLPEGRYIYFEVKDTGRGMGKDTLERVFEPFYTTKAKGRGLGLAVVSGVAGSHEGGIEVESKKGVGTRFRVLLPWPEKTLAPVHETKAQKKDIWNGKGAILVVDDEEEVLAMTKMILELAGYEVLTASSGEQALMVFSEKKDEIAAVMLDLIMPTMKGDEVFRELCRQKEGLKVMFLSGYHELDVSNLDGNDCPVSVLQKPYKINDMLEKMHDMLKR